MDLIKEQQNNLYSQPLQGMIYVVVFQWISSNVQNIVITKNNVNVMTEKDINWNWMNLDRTIHKTVWFGNVDMYYDASTKVRYYWDSDKSISYHVSERDTISF